MHVYVTICVEVLWQPTLLMVRPSTDIVIVLALMLKAWFREKGSTSTIPLFLHENTISVAVSFLRSLTADQ